MGLIANLLGMMVRDWSLVSSRPTRSLRHEQLPPQEPPILFTREILAEHCAIFAPSGHGKTQLLQHLIVYFLDKFGPMPIWVIDNQGDMLNKLARLDIFNPVDGILKDALVLIDPEDQQPPALNLFSLDANDATSEDLMFYIFTAIDNSLTPQQSTTVTFLMRLMRVIPNATLHTLRKVLEDRSKSAESSPWFPHVQKLDETARDFFANQFYQTGAMQITRNSIARRLYGLLGNPVFAKMFAAPYNTFDPDAALRENKIVLVNTSQKLLGDDSRVLGRFFIAQALAAAYRRPPHNSSTALLVVDEAAQYFDYKTERLLSTARKFGLGMIVATQFLEQLEREIKAAIYGNTAIKIVGPVSFTDANSLAREMRTDAETIQNLKKHAGGAEFALHIRSTTPRAIKVNFPFRTVENMERMTSERFEQLKTANRERYGVSREAPTSPSVLPHNVSVSFPDYNVTMSGLLDSGATTTVIPADDLLVENDTATFKLNGTLVTLPIERSVTFTGFANETARLPIVKMKMRVADHEAAIEVALNRPLTELLVGRNFMAGRILIESKDTPW